jgi:prepilin-type N-terminal cleavage/methylation domain-containing protein
VKKGFSLLEVLIAVVILAFGIASLLAKMAVSQQLMLSAAYLETAQEVMDLGDMAYPLSDVKDPDNDLDVRETKATDLWDLVSEVELSKAQEEKFHGYTWEREALNRTDDEDDIKRLGNLYTVRITVRWGDRGKGSGRMQQESYVTFWRKPE